MTQIPNERFMSGLHPEQVNVLREFDSHRKRFFELKWHRRARKTTLILNILIRECLRNPNHVYPYVGPTYRQAKSIVWRDPNMLFSYLPDRNKVPWVSNESELYIRFPNSSILPIKGGDDPDSLRGLNANGVGFDEWALMKQIIWTEIFRPIIAEDINRWAIFAWTPKGENHAADIWRLSEKWPDWYRSLLKASKSGLIPRKELEKARREMPTWMYEQEFECADITDEELTLITSRLLDGLRFYKQTQGYLKKLVSCDPDASIAGDECVIYYFENYSVEDEKIMRERDPKKIAHEINLMCKKHNTSNTAIDTIGVGLGVVSDCNALKLNVIPFDSREKALRPKRFANKRAEAHWYVMELMQDHEVPYPKDLLLRQDLTAVRINPAGRHGRILLEKNLKTSARLGRSPDRGEAYKIGIYSQQFVQPESEDVDAYGRGGSEEGGMELAKSYVSKSNF